MCELDCSDLGQKHMPQHTDTHTHRRVFPNWSTQPSDISRERAQTWPETSIEEKLRWLGERKMKNRMLELARRTVGARFAFRISKRLEARFDTLDGLLWQNVSKLPDARLHPMDDSHSHKK